jgi:hypothetical protein
MWANTFVASDQNDPTILLPKKPADFPPLDDFDARLYDRVVEEFFPELIMDKIFGGIEDLTCPERLSLPAGVRRTIELYPLVPGKFHHAGTLILPLTTACLK